MEKILVLPILSLYNAFDREYMYIARNQISKYEGPASFLSYLYVMSLHTNAGIFVEFTHVTHCTSYCLRKNMKMCLYYTSQVFL